MCVLLFSIPSVQLSILLVSVDKTKFHYAS